jgi:glycine/D-amino acid oxidase-like deaminating enzyme
MTGTIPARSPWLEQLRTDRAPQPLDRDLDTDVVVVGSGIAGASTAFFTLRDTDRRVVLIERGRIGHGATGHNAGQLATYFERPLLDLVREYGFELAIDAQRCLDGSWDLVDLLLAEIDADIRIDRFMGHMGMFTLNHVMVHLRHSELRRRGGLTVPDCLISEEAPFLADVPSSLDGLYEVVPAADIAALLGKGNEKYCAVLCSPVGTANGALLVEQIVDHLQQRYPERFRYVDHTHVDRVVLHADHADVHAGAHTVRTARVVMCTNGFVDHLIENLAGDDIDPTMHHHLIGTKGYMAGVVEHAPSEPGAYSFIRNAEIGQDTPYIYVTRRPWGAPAGPGMLVCFGGPEEELDDASTYEPEAEYPLEMFATFDEEVLPLAYPTRPAGEPYEYRWHGLMGYTRSRVRMVGAEPRNPVLLYNLGCNGVGFMPSIYGGQRIARMLAGDDLGPSIFDPPR